MSKFGIIGEGITDQITIENILCGFFENPNLDEEIEYLKPPVNQPDKGGWWEIFKYLALEDFRNDVLNNEIIIFQIDTDITTKEEDSKKFGLYYKDENVNEFSIEELIAKVVTVLINKINIGDLGFYEQYAHKIIFAISVHSIECWLVAYYAEAKNLLDCFNELRNLKIPNNIQVAKKVRNYDLISQPFLIRENIETVVQKDKSFNFFIQQLGNIAA